MAGNFFAKVIGLTAIGIASCDTLETTKQQSPRYARKIRVEQLNDIYMGTTESDSTSVIGSKMDGMIRRWNLDNNLFGRRQKIVAYVKCFFRNLSNNVLLLGLGALALFTGNGKLSLIKIPVINKLAAGLILLKGCGFVAKRILGLGADDYRKNIMKQ